MISTDIDFPVQVPCVLRRDYGFRHGQPFRRTSMASGRERQRRAFTNVPSQIAVTWRCNDSDARLFEAWFRDVLQDGAAWFNMLIKTPLGMTSNVCRFAEMYVGPRLVSPRRWEIDATLEVYERPLLPPGWGEFPDLVAGMSIFDIAMNRVWPEA